MTDQRPVTDWVDDVLLAGADDDTCLWLGAPVSRASLRAAVLDRQERLASAGLAPGGNLALRLPPSLAYVAQLLAGWRIGARVTLLDYRLTQFEVDAALDRVGAQLVVEPATPVTAALRCYHDITERITARSGAAAQTPHALIQLSSGSTGPSKVIGRTAEDLVTEVNRYVAMDGVARRGERIVLLASMVHVLGLVGGLLYGLHARVPITLPERMTVDDILTAVAADPAPTTVIGVPVHIDLLTAPGAPPPRLPQLVRMTTGGELVRPDLPERFAARYGATLGNMYGMTEVGVIATDLFGQHRPAVRPAPGIEVRVVDGELQVSRPQSPYVGLSDSTRWADGWLRTRDAATIDPVTGLVTVHGRLDSQVSVGGLKVDLTEVEQAVAGLPEVAEAVVSFDGAIEVYAVLRDLATPEDLDKVLAERLAPYKRPRRWHVLERLPRTSSGKVVRDRSVLRDAAQGTTAGEGGA
ncbi:MAG TPA: class I adenylate-forming enzyme family protein [Micromonosporaceae bacterium]|nr:class I adenylate-forming enzyme family protein [Micromonosporaceae bacterium]